MTNSAKVVRDNNNIKIIDVAFDFYFSSHEGYTSAFSKKFNITTKKYHKSPISIKYFIPYLIKKESIDFCLWLLKLKIYDIIIVSNRYFIKNFYL